MTTAAGPPPTITPAAGGVLMGGMISVAMMLSFKHRRDDDKRRRKLLTKRQVEVLRLVCGGLSDRAIAKALEIGIRHVRLHVRRLRAKVLPKWMKKGGYSSRVMLATIGTRILQAEGR